VKRGEFHLVESRDREITKAAVHCDELVSLPKAVLTNYVGSLKLARTKELDRALSVALGLRSVGLLP
jgi:mRNA-degrading endonuclease toxin of MazEF toxin-antitoxin module